MRTVGLRTLRAQLFSVCWWSVGLVIGVGWITMLTRSMEDPLRKVYAHNPVLYQLFGGHDISTNAGFLAGAIFAFVPVITVIFALLQALSWASDLERGRMELVLSTPTPRYRLMLEHVGAVFVAAVVVLLAIWLSVLAGARMTDLSVDVSHVFAASLGSPGAIVSLSGTFVALSFFVELLHAVLKLPEWVMSLSIFHQYGSPITDGWQWRPFVTMLGIAALLLALGVVQFTHSDVERGA